MIEVTYSKAINRKYPEPVVLIISCDTEGKPNIMPAGWTMSTSFMPPMLAISIGHQRYTHKLITETGEFVRAILSEEIKAIIDRIMFRKKHQQVFGV